MESERHEEKYRAVIDGETQDEPVGQRWGNSLSEKPVHHRPRILEANLNLTDVRKVHLAVAFSLPLRSCVFVKAACGKTARAVWRRTEASAQARPPTRLQ